MATLNPPNTGGRFYVDPQSGKRLPANPDGSNPHQKPADKPKPAPAPKKGE